MNQREFDDKLSKILAQLKAAVPKAPKSKATLGREIPFDVPFAKALRIWQRQRLLDALERHREGAHWNISATSREVKMARSQTYRLMRRLKIPSSPGELR